MIDIFDIIAFGVFAILIVACVIVGVLVGSLPGKIARKRGHPQAAAINVAGWLGLATLGILWPFALVWAFYNPAATVLPLLGASKLPNPASGNNPKEVPS